ncbi:MAG TPA: 50S ribosomal protein L23 [Candidatus Paceibacterota bacterium]|jgi:large subunit ribosomal protein L23|nr:50S ribosomal protein L23 [Parcubacteria group bacterium]HOM33112.1 50S ribosomal protein L23 [Candidatus Paceibacterota bacterium]HPC37355.1 50S ribosomal protein L23 [Candidatus Paceibacterota bacterium]HRU35829.1 50S ribosomal protein L23 [Candidatus Paceibacterota bacterium]
MSIFSSKKQEKNKSEKEKKEVKIKEKEKERKETIEKESKQPLEKKVKLTSNKNLLLIKHPHVTEKSQLLKEYRQYVFQTVNKINKSEIKKAIEQIYNVKVEKVRIIEIPAKKRRAGAGFGKKSGYKKAIVTLKEGYQIEIIPQK